MTLNWTVFAASSSYYPCNTDRPKFQPGMNTCKTISKQRTLTTFRITPIPTPGGCSGRRLRRSPFAALPLSCKGPIVCRRRRVLLAKGGRAGRTKSPAPTQPGLARTWRWVLEGRIPQWLEWAVKRGVNSLRVVTGNGPSLPQVSRQSSRQKSPRSGALQACRMVRRHCPVLHFPASLRA